MNERQTKNGGRRPDTQYASRGSSQRTGSPGRSGQRKSVRRKKAHAWLFYSVILIFVISIGVILSLTVLFKINQVLVDGTTQYKAEDIIAASKVKTGENLFLCNTASGQASVEKKLPYIQKAVISRRIPDTIVITVTEAETAGSASYNGSYILLSTEGKVLATANAPAEGVPVIKGLDLKSANVSEQAQYNNTSQQTAMQEVAAAIEENGLKNITEIDMTNIYNIVLNYAGRIKIELGIPSDLTSTLKFAQTLLTKNITEQDKGTLDLSLFEENNRGYFKPDYGSSEAQSSVQAAK
jgi:cell division septal protein FtsQ